MFTIIGGDNKPYGPSTADEVREWIRQGRADGRTLARLDSGEWKPLATFPEFADVLNARGVPPMAPESPASGAPSVPYGAATTEQILARDADFSVSDCLGHGWNLWMNHFGLLTAAVFIVWALDLFLHAIPFVEIFLHGVLYGGLFLVFLKCIRGSEAKIGDALAGFRSQPLHLLLAGLLTALLTSLSLCCCYLPALYLKVAWIFSLALVIDKKMEFWSAMELSRKIATRAWFKVFALALIAFLPFIVIQGYTYYRSWSLLNDQLFPLLMSDGMPDMSKVMANMPKIKDTMTALGSQLQYLVLGTQVVLLVNLPFATGALMYAYEALFGTRTKTSA